MQIWNHCAAESLGRRRDTEVAVAFVAMAGTPRDYVYPYPAYRTRSIPKLWRIVFERKVERMVRERGIDLLYGSMLDEGGFVAVKIARKLGLPVAVHSHGGDILTVDSIGYGAGLNRRRKARSAYALAHADVVIAQSESVRRSIAASGLASAAVHVVPQATFAQQAETIAFADTRRGLGLTEDDFVIMTVGRNEPVKRIDLLFQSLVLLRDSGRRIKCLCVGPRGNLDDLVRRHGLDGTVTVVGPIPKAGLFGPGEAPPLPQLVNLYRAADLYVSVSHVESFGMAGLDALACGTPVLVSGRHGIAELLDPGNSGFVVEDETPARLAAAIGGLSEDPGQLRRRRGDIIDSVRHLTWDNTAGWLRDLFGSLT
jgi:D-inositol-3-phosphate glycosyltransferase